MTSMDTAPSQPAWTPVPPAFWDGLRQLITPYVFCSFVVPGKPQSKERRNGSGRAAFTPKLTRDAEKRVLEAFREAMPGWEPEPDGTYGVLIEFDTESGSRSDLDNLTKLVWDALNTQLWLDDIQVGMALLRLVRGGDPNSTVWVFGMQNNGTPLTSLCECGSRYRSAKKMCDACIRRRKAVADLLRDDDVDAVEFAKLQRRVFNHIAARMTGYGVAPSMASIAEHLQIPESRVRAAIDALIQAGNLKRGTDRKLTIIRPLGAAA